jgi:hypothetical protein
VIAYSVKWCLLTWRVKVWFWAHGFGFMKIDFFSCSHGNGGNSVPQITRQEAVTFIDNFVRTSDIFGELG